MDKAKALDSCLEALQRGESLEACLARYPRQAGELEPLLKAALLVQRASHVPAPPQFKAAARSRLLASLQPRPRALRRRAFAWQWRWSVAAASLLVILLTGSTVALANSSLPDQSLYPVKIATEEARLALTPGDLAKARLEIKLAQRRTQEITEMARKNRPQQIDRASQRLDRQINRVGNRAAQHQVEENRNWEDMEARLEQRAAQHRAALEKAMRQAPPPARPALRRAQERSNARFQEAQQKMQERGQGRQKMKGEKGIPGKAPPAETEPSPGP